MAEILGIGSRVGHPVFGAGVVVALENDFYQVYFFSQNGVKEISTSYESFTVKDKSTDGVVSIDYDKIKDVVYDVMMDLHGHERKTFIASKWKHGNMVLKPGDASLQVKEVPIETFFHKIVMLRDKLRVLEQQINSHAKLDEDEKINLQKYITACYGSLTTFNVFFSEKEDQFKGSSNKE